MKYLAVVALLLAGCATPAPKNPQHAFFVHCETCTDCTADGIENGTLCPEGAEHTLAGVRWVLDQHEKGLPVGRYTPQGELIAD